VIVEIIDETSRLDAFLAACGDALADYTYIRERVTCHIPGPQQPST
jgi:hypothetical protein